MIRVGGTLKIGLMAGIAGRGCVHVAGRVARDASQRRMCAGQGKCGLIVIKTRRSPTVGCMTNPAVLSKITGHVIGIDRGREIGLVARIAGLRRIDESGRMAGGAGLSSVLSGKRKSNNGVIEKCRRPAAGGMTFIAVLAEIALNMIRVFGLGIICLMAVIAGCWRVDIPGGMTGNAG